jgi:thioredoxin reductase/ferredoxin
VDDASLPVIAATLLGSVVGWRILAGRGREARARAALEAARAAGAKPLTRHPEIDASRCLLCGSCIAACPETHGLDSPLAIVDGVVRLVNPRACVGHGECEAACPTGAVRVTLGDLARDPTIPPATPEGESALVPGIFFAGELSGTPLIKNAIAQGKAAVEAIAARLEAQARAPRARGRTPAPAGRGAPRDEGDLLDVVIVGLGPAGLSAALAAHERGLRYVAIEQGPLGGTVASFPREKLVLTAPVDIPVHGRFARRETSKEELLALWRGLAERTGLRARTGERVLGIDRAPDGTLCVRAASGAVRARAVVLAIGRRGTPRRLGVPGEDRPKVTYQLTDPGLHRGREVLVVGGGDSAVESALILAKGNRVTLSYRGEAFTRLKPRNADRLAAALERGEARLLLGSRVLEIGARDVTLATREGERRLPNDLVVVQAGGEPALPFLRAAGVVAPEGEEAGADAPR